MYMDAVVIAGIATVLLMIGFFVGEHGLSRKGRLEALRQR